MGPDLEAWIRSRRREEVGERGANITDLLCGRESSLGVRGDIEPEDGGVMVRFGEGGVGARLVGGIGMGFIRDYRPLLAEDSHMDHEGLPHQAGLHNLEGYKVG